MTRDAHIPLVLWISAAIVVHLAGGEGAVEVAQIVEEREQFRSMVNAVREGVRADMTFEVLALDVEPTPSLEKLPPPKDAPENKDANREPDHDDPKPEPTVTPKAPPPPKLVKLPPRVPPTEEAKKPPPPTVPKPPPPPPPVVAKVEPVTPPVAPPPPPPAAEKRLAVQQHVEKNQEDNPTANRIADDANHTKEETMARVRAYDTDAPDPTPGSGSSGPKDEVGNNDHTKTAQSEDKQGNRDHAPGEAKRSSTSIEHHNPAPSAPAGAAMTRGSSPSAPGSRGANGGPANPPPPSQASPGSAGGAGPASPEVASGDQGSWRIDPANPGGDGSSRSAGRKRAATPYQPPVSVGNMGFGAPGPPDGPNLNLTMSGLEAAVGHDQLKRERAADGAARRTAHRGSSDPNGKWNRMKAAVENYDPSVKPGNQTALNAARVPFASYINAVHNRLHPIFAEEFLSALDNLPAGHVLNQNLVTHVEIVLSKDEGRIVRLGVTRASGSTAFDVVAVNSISRASPFGSAPDAIVSPDGNVYLHWEFHRDPVDACTTRNARPYIVNTPPRPSTPGAPRKTPSSPPSDGSPAPPPLLPLRRP